MRRNLFLSLFIAITLLAFSQTAVAASVTPYDIFKGSTLNKIIQKKVLRVGMEVEYFPFEYSDKKGNPVGFDVDLAKLIAKELGVKLEIKDTEWTGLIP